MASSAASLASERSTPGLRVLLLLMAFAFLCHLNRVGMSVVGTEKLIKAPAEGETSNSAISGKIEEPATRSSPVSQELAFSPEQMGRVYSAYLLVYTLMMIPGGWLIDRAGPRRALGVMGLGSAVLVVLTGLPGWGLVPVAAALPLFIAIRAALGLFTTPMHPGAARMVSLTFPPAIRSWGNGMVTGAAVFGVSSTYYLFGLLMDALDWPGVFLVSGLATLAVTTAWWIAVPAAPAQTAVAVPSTGNPHETSDVPPVLASEPGAGVRWGGVIYGMLPLLRNRGLVLVTISYGAFGYFQYTFFYWMQYYFSKILEMSKDDSRLYATIPNVAMAFGMIAGGFVSDRLQHVWGLRWGRAAVPIVSMFGSAAFALIGVHVAHPLSVEICFALSMGLFGMSEGPFWTTAVDLGGRRGGLAAAIFNTGGNFGGTLATYLTAFLGQRYEWRVGFEVACLFCLCGAVLWFWITPAHPETAS